VVICRQNEQKIFKIGVTMAIKKKGTSKKPSKKSQETGVANVDVALKALQAKYGVETVRRISDKPKLPRLSTELIGLDSLLGGGLPLGRIIEIYGPESSGKTTVAVTIAGAFQRVGKKLAIIDVEQALDPEWCAKLGCDIDNSIHVQPESGEDALNITNEIMQSDLADILIVDSVAALTTQQELEKEIGESTVGQQAKLMSGGLKKLIATANKSGKTIIFINQMRKKIGGYGNPETTSGGEALKYYASIRLEVRRIGTRKDGDIAIGNDVRIKSVKNKTYRPYVSKEFFLSFTSGYDKVEDLVNTAISEGVVHQGGAWLTYGDHKVQGKPNFSTLLSGDKALYDEIYSKVMNSLSQVTKDTQEEIQEDEEAQVEEKAEEEVLA
jgi:recombination protein RecA